MPLPSSGQLSMGYIRAELGLSGQVSLQAMSNAAGLTTQPYTIDEFHGYSNVQTVVVDLEYFATTTSWNANSVTWDNETEVTQVLLNGSPVSGTGFGGGTVYAELGFTVTTSSWLGTITTNSLYNVSGTNTNLFEISQSRTAWYANPTLVSTSATILSSPLNYNITINDSIG